MSHRGYHYTEQGKPVTRAIYNKTSRDWVMYVAGWALCDEQGEPLHYLTAQDAYDAHAAIIEHARNKEEQQ